MRDFYGFCEVAREIIEISPEPLKTQLLERVSFWAPEICWERLSIYVNKYLEPDSNNPTTVKIYSLLCDCSEEEMIRRFKDGGF